jgi:hypothetical protein
MYNTMSKKAHILPAIFILLCFSAICQVPEFKWSRPAVSEYASAVYGVTVDKDNNIYCVGYSDAPFQFYPESEGIEPWSGPREEFFLVKFNAMGKYQWIKSGGGIGYEAAGSVSTDEDGNVIMGCTSESKEVYIDGDTLKNTAYSTGLILKYNSSGQKLWVKQIGTGGGQFSPQVKTDFDRNIYVLTRQNNISIVYKLDQDGNTKWSRLIPQTYVSSLQFKNNQIYLGGGSFADTLYYSQNLIGMGYPGFILRLDTNGNFVSHFAAAGLKIPATMALDNQLNVFLTGTFFGTLSLGATTLASGSSSDMYVIKVDSTNNLQWARAIIKEGSALPFSSAVVFNGDIMIAGAIHITSCSPYGPCCYPVYSFPNAHFYLVQLSGADGLLKWERKNSVPANGTCGTYASCVAASPVNGEIVIGGYSGNYHQISTDDFFFSGGPCFIAGTSSARVSVEEHFTLEERLFPNPCKNQLIIETSRPSDVQIINVFGQLVKEEKTKQVSRSVDVRDFPEGVYVVKIFSEGKAVQRKIVVSH